MTSTPRLPPRAIQAPLVFLMFPAAAVLAALWPLHLWALSLAVFGVPHVLVELHWVQRRYGWVVPRGALVAALLLLAGIVLLRLTGAGLGLPPPSQGALELVLVTLLLLTVLPLAWRRSARAGWFGLGACVILALGITQDPINTLLVLAFLHNLTPLGLLWDRLRDPGGAAAPRWAWGLLALAVFGLLPALLLTGVLPDLLGPHAVDPPRVAGLAVGWGDGVGAFVPTWAGPEWQGRLFRTAAFLQIVHYTAVLWFMPRLGARAGGGAGLARPGPLPLVLLVGLAALFTWSFFQDFRGSKAAYGVLAAVHAWVELPVLLLALSGLTVAAPGHRTERTAATPR